MLACTSHLAKSSEEKLFFSPSTSLLSNHYSKNRRGERRGGGIIHQPSSGLNTNMENIGEFALQEGKQSLMREAKTFEVLDVLVKDQ